MATTSDTLRQLSDQGVAIWLDDMSRARLSTGTLADLIRDKHVVGATTNPTIFQKALDGSAFYDEQGADLAQRGLDVEEAVRMITTYDVRWACDVFAPVYEASNGVDGRVSIEVDPASRTTRRRASLRLASSGGSSTRRTCSSRSPRQKPGCPRSRSASPRASAST